MNAWQSLLVTCGGNVFFFLLQMAYFRYKKRSADQLHLTKDTKKEGEHALKFELMWKDFKERKKINGVIRG